MALGDTFDLGRVLAQAQQIKGFRRQEGEDAIRRQYLQAQIANTTQAGQIAGQQETRDQGKYQTEVDARTAKTRYLEADAITRSANPIEAVKNFAPELITNFDSTHGPGSFAKLSAEQVKQLATMGRDKAAAIAGIQPEVEYVDIGGQKVAIDKNTGQQVGGLSPLNKTASPDSVLSADTSRRGQDIGAQTAAAGHGVTMRGQDIGAQTASAGRDVTIRGQDLTAATARTTQGAKVTETQGNAKAFGLRATAANTSLETLIAPTSKGGGGYNPTGTSGAFDALVSGRLGTNWLASPYGQKYQTLAKAFIAPILRKESGAAIQESEWEAARQIYIPWPGDKPERLAVKAENRRNAIQGLAVQAGPGGIPTPEGPPAGGPVRIQGDADYAKLPSGTQYTDPQGNVRTKR